MTTIAFIGFGEAGRAFTDTLRDKGGTVSAAYDRIDSPNMAAAMSDRSVRQAGDPGAAAEGADWIVSAVTADQSFIAIETLAPHLVQGQVVFDINSVSPDRKRASAELVEARGAHYIDMAVMAPVHPRGHATPTLVAGGQAAALTETLCDLGFAHEVVSDAAGDATAVKMVRSLFVKGLEAITVETLLAAEASGCFARVLASLEKSHPSFGWPDQAVYNFERTLRHGTRRAAEMDESASTLSALGLNGGLAAEVARIQRMMGALDAADLAEGDLSEVARAVAARRLTAGGDA
ncbi:DUF1932 domain-containing protein (plasmid) [Roseivivax marinus]|uniref:NAD(P)-dependent oxidoreductase n=1 Tax=Roseivivax marinus TaxID=1379903 RepID=UPI001F037721|nr:DUF1932 domain-containing protein [Roseivivax marinus]UMA67160.1 DUF1932 domain-containing protein [Roseivivax marinus]